MNTPVTTNTTTSQSTQGSVNAWTDGGQTFHAIDGNYTVTLDPSSNFRWELFSDPEPFTIKATREPYNIGGWVSALGPVEVDKDGYTSLTFYCNSDRFSFHFSPAVMQGLLDLLGDRFGSVGQLDDLDGFLNSKDEGGM